MFDDRDIAFEEWWNSFWNQGVPSLNDKAMKDAYDAMRQTARRAFAAGWAAGREDLRSDYDSPWE